MRQHDVVALIFGLVLSAVALLSLWQLFIGPLNWGLVKVGAPLGLVVVGVVGLALSRNRE